MDANAGLPLKVAHKNITPSKSFRREFSVNDESDERVPFIVTFSCELNYDITSSKELSKIYPEAKVKNIIESVRSSLIKGLKMINHIYPALLTVQPVNQTTIVVLPGAPDNDFFDDFDASFIDDKNGIKVVRTKVYVHKSNINNDFSLFILYDLLSKCSWKDPTTIPYGLDFGTRKFLTQSFKYRTGKSNIKVNWLTEEVAAAFFASLVGMDKFVEAFVSSSSDMLEDEIVKRTNDSSVYPKLCVFKHKELLQFIFFIITEPKNNFPDVEQFIEFGKKNGYDFSRLFELLSNLPKYKHIFKGETE
ncbi:hypothetical protein J7J90_02595 [Candidatus Micrarchaeota archaeon]|nr:hypothetical protein [Candidatus Micrarchaeota archaeon]